MSTRRAMVLMIAFAAAWALLEAIAGDVLMKYSPFQVVFTRYVVHLALLLPIAVAVGARPHRTSRLGYQIGRSLLMLGMPASFVFAFQNGVDPRTLNLIFWTSPLLVLAIASVHLRERSPITVWVLVSIAAAGAVLTIGRGSFGAPAALVFPVGMALTFSLYVVMTRSLRSESTVANLFYTALGPALSLLPFMPKLWLTPAPFDLLVMIAIGSFGLLGLWALDRAAALAPLSHTAPFLYLQLPIFVLLERVLRGTHFGVRVAVGSLAIGVCLAYLWHTSGAFPSTAKARPLAR